MRIGRTIPPAAAPIPWKNVFGSVQAVFFGRNAVERQLEDQLKRYFGTRHCFLVSSGKAALTLILQALHRLTPDRQEVLIPAFTCFSVPASIHRAGLQVKICDTAPDCLDFDRTALRRLFAPPESSRKILAVIPTHFYGIPADLKYLREAAGKEIPLIEDAAQSMGEESDNGMLGTSGDIGFFSLGRGKALSCSNGGIIVTNRDDIAVILAGMIEELADADRPSMAVSAAKAAITNILLNPYLYWLPKSLPFLHLGETLYEEDFSLRSFSPVQRRLAEDWLQRLNSFRHLRRRNASFYRSSLPPPFKQLTPAEFDGSMIRMPVLAPSHELREIIIRKSECDGLGIMPVYPTPVDRIGKIADRFSGEEAPNAESLCERMFTLPVHPAVSGRDREKIITLLKNSCST